MLCVCVCVCVSERERKTDKLKSGQRRKADGQRNRKITRQIPNEDGGRIDKHTDRQIYSWTYGQKEDIQKTID